MTAPISILIAEDQGMMRSALASLLELEDDLRVVEQVARGDEVLAAVERTVPDVVLLDIELPGRNGLDLIAELLQAAPGMRVVIVTTFGRPGYLRRAMAAGASGFLVKDDPVEQLARAIREVCAGGIVVDPALSAQALRAGPDPLSEREREVLVASADGATIADVAIGLHLSESTVRNYLSAAIGKLGARNRGEALSIARRSGWV
ncbi:response regulator transcription factor [Agrococcus sp. ARC_14]|uniref:response regulator transcription factor n=1 Tax=Agrococcus sp. ARC_14 TaxID=2919927 RepID=UPI001F0557E8|nr:response regulator transcription factor [Agrococcus sp. ARC_14]